MAWILLDNATKYTAAPGIIKVRLSACAKTAAATVEDNGRSISPAGLPHIFERFYRADPSRSEVEGCGLGLSIAKWIAQVHQATLSVESRENAGSVFALFSRCLPEDQEVQASCAPLTVSAPSDITPAYLTNQSHPH